MVRQILTREQLQRMSPEEVMAAYRGGHLDYMVRRGPLTGPVDPLTEQAAALVDSMEDAFGVQHTRPSVKEMATWGGQIVRTVLDDAEPVHVHVPDLVEKIAETRKALS